MDASLNQLRMIVELSHRGTISATAAALDYTPSAVSQQLSALERGVGVDLLERVGRNVRLTDAGWELVGHATDVLRRMELAGVAVERAAAEVSGTLDLALFESAAARLLPGVLRLLRERHPALRLHTRQLDPDQSLQELQGGLLDAAVVLDYPNWPGARPDGIDRHLICTDWFRLVAPHEAGLGPGPVDLADLADHDFIGSPVGLSCGRLVVSACRDAGFEPRLAHQIDDFSTTLHLVAAGAGIALIPDMGLERIPDGVVVHQLRRPISRVLEVAMRSSNAGRPAVEALVRAFDEAARDVGLDTAAA